MNHFWMKVAVAIVALTAVGSAAAYPWLPTKMPMHWNVHGEVDGWGHRQLVVPLMPAVMIGLLGLFAALPWLSPRHKRLERRGEV